MTRKSIHNIAQYFIRGKEVLFHIPGEFPITIIIPSVMKRYFPYQKSIIVRCAETVYHLLKEDGGSITID